MKKKTKPKAKPKPKKSPVEVAVQLSKVVAGQAAVAIIESCVASYEKTTGAKANQTRLIDFVRWCEDNSGLL